MDVEKGAGRVGRRYGGEGRGRLSVYLSVAALSPQE